MEVAQALTVHQYVDGGWCWTKYNAGPYHGCSYECVYCYNLGSGNGIGLKKDFTEKFRREIATVPKDVITVSDYQPIEAELNKIREVLEVIVDFGFPLHIIEKSPLVVRDIDVIKKIAEKSWAAVSMSVTASPALPQTEKNLTFFEPDAPTSKERFQAMKKLSDAGILTGTCCVPLIPYIGDSRENIESLIKETSESGGKYFILGSLVIPEPFDRTFWEVIEERFSDKLEALRSLFNPNNLDKFREYFGALDRETSRLCETYGLLDHIARPVGHYPEQTKNNKLIAEKFFLKARFAKANKFSLDQEYSYMALAWLLEDIPEDITGLYANEGKKVLSEMGLEEYLADEVEEEINEMSKKIK